MQMVERRESITTSCQNVRGCEWRVKEDKLLRLSALGPTLPPVGRNCNTLQVRQAVFQNILINNCDPHLRSLAENSASIT